MFDTYIVFVDIIFLNFLLCALFQSKFLYFFWTVSMVMFSTFEHSVNFLYRNVIQRKKEDCSRTQQLGVTCLAGYAAGSIGSIISNPADNIVASLNNKKADSIRKVIFLMVFLLKHFVHHNFWLSLNSVLMHHQVVKKIGLAKLFTRSLPIRIMLVGPAVTLQWLFYDSIKVLSGLYV